ncbi:fungal specific transcription factor [Trichoderma harzianum]|uniref:Fungal specific transcription factor n=1 Tax=Trichoderma harzianum TaxID=5544 RepID=A0A0F9X598_TRIHA|nr:fungal specific transcription factor [Trichoderma harzianum]
MDESMQPARSAHVRKRAMEACIFCRRRKIKCNNEQPACANCRTYGKDCIYEPLSDSSRLPAPSKLRAQPSRRSKAAQRRPRPRVSRNNEAAVISPAGLEQDPACLNQTFTAHQSQQAPHRPRSREGFVSPGASRLVVSANGMASYHGRTSALFDENLPDRLPGEFRPRMPDEWVEKGLVAEAAKQRQLEELNFRAGKLDFDTVNPDLGMHLLSLHWNRQHHSFLITYRPAFMRDMACGGPYFSKLLLNAIYFGAAKFSPRLEVRKDSNDPRTAGWKFRQRVRELLGGSLDRSDITTIQALLVMTNSLFALGDERNAAWLYSGLAFRMIIDLGIHVDTTDRVGARRLSDEDIEIRRRVFWGAFVVDKIQSLYQGRPATLRELDALVPIKFLDTFEEFEYWEPFAYTPQPNPYLGSAAHSVSTFTHLCKLSVVMSDILSNIYTERIFTTDLSTVLQGLHSKLTTWRDALPPHLVVKTRGDEYPCPPPHVLSLHAMYHVLIILLHRPFVADGHLHNMSRSISVNSFLECASAASNIVSLLRAYDRAFSVRRAPYLISYATYVAATIHARIAAKREHASEEHRSLETCLAVFRENQATNWAVRRANLVIRNLMKRLGVSINEGEEGLRIHVDREAGSALPMVGSVGSAQGPNPSTDPSIDDRPAGSPSKSWLNIDEIMQSFVREGEQCGQKDSVVQPLVPMVQHDDLLSIQGGSASLHIPKSIQYGPVITHSQPRDHNASQDGETQAATWHHPGTDVIVGTTSSVDDLLFGFNGSALDSFQLLEWESM